MRCCITADRQAEKNTFSWLIITQLVVGLTVRRRIRAQKKKSRTGKVQRGYCDPGNSTTHSVPLVLRDRWAIQVEETTLFTPKCTAPSPARLPGLPPHAPQKVQHPHKGMRARLSRALLLPARQELLTHSAVSRALDCSFSPERQAEVWPGRGAVPIHPRPRGQYSRGGSCCLGTPTPWWPESSLLPGSALFRAPIRTQAEQASPSKLPPQMCAVEPPSPFLFLLRVNSTQ